MNLDILADEQRELTLSAATPQGQRWLGALQSTAKEVA
jgi:hypothetical protein